MLQKSSDVFISRQIRLLGIGNLEGEPEVAASHSDLMDSIYRYQRHFYDATRCFFLAGRDALLRRMELNSGDFVLEVGCGTARNLIRLARRNPAVQLFGLDISAEMLATARESVAAEGLDDRISLRKGPAEELDSGQVFGSNPSFDVVFFSYALTMIPGCVEALDASIRSLSPGGRLYIVDFYDHRGWSPWVRTALQNYLRLFHVEHKPQVLGRLREVCSSQGGSLWVEPVARRHAFIAGFVKYS